MTDEELDLLLSGARDGTYTVIRWFDAAYDSECNTCGGEICTGERAGYVDDDDRASCESCCEKAS